MAVQALMRCLLIAVNSACFGFNLAVAHFEHHLIMRGVDVSVLVIVLSALVVTALVAAYPRRSW